MALGRELITKVSSGDKIHFKYFGELGEVIKIPFMYFCSFFIIQSLVPCVCGPTIAINNLRKDKIRRKKINLIIKLIKIKIFVHFFHILVCIYNI